MSEFIYRGVDRAGKRVDGKMDVATEGDLRMALRGMGVRPVSISKSKGSGTGTISLFGAGKIIRVPVPIVVLFTRQLQLLISSGIPLVQALEVLSDQTSHPGMKSILTQTRERVSGGSYLWETMNAFPGAFPKLYVSLIRAGEASGAMESMLKRLSKYLEDQDRLKKMIKSAMMYPIIVSAIGFGVVALMLTFVIPKFEAMLKQSNQELPALTQYVINASHFFQHNFLYIVGAIGFVIFSLNKYVSTAEGRAVKDRLVFRAPLFGVLAQKSGVARFTRTLQTLLSAGVNLVDAIDVCKSAADNAVIEEAVGRIRGEVESGKTLGMILSKMDVFPKMASQMVMVGESTGNLDKSLEKIADFYESDVEVLVGGLTKLIEPLVLVVLGGLVGGLMIAMYLPIFKMAGAAG